MAFKSDITRKTDCISHRAELCRCQDHVSPKVLQHAKSFSLFYNDLARWLFITLAFTGILSTGWFGIPLVPSYFLHNEIDILSSLFTLFSALGTIWGVMAYREFTFSANLINDARDLARKLDPMIGDYQYRSYNPETKDYEKGYVPMGPIDFWDRETQVPDWLDKGKYWHILLGLQTSHREIVLQVVQDRDLPFLEDPRNVAVTSREFPPSQSASEKRIKKKKYRYRVKIPQWLVMSTDFARVEKLKDNWNIGDSDMGTFLTRLNTTLAGASEEIVEREKPRIKYPMKISALGIYLNKSLPIRIVYKQAIRYFPGSKKRTIEYTNENLANIADDQLAGSIIDIAINKGIPSERLNKFRILVLFIRNEYNKQGIGEGSGKYHNFHHSLEVTYLSLQMLPKELRGHIFTWKEYELLLVAGLLHDYDPSEAHLDSIQIDKNNDAVTAQPRGPRVYRTIEALSRTRIVDAYFTMSSIEFENYFKEYKSSLLLPIELSTTHPEYVKVDWKPTESLVIEALIWRTDFPFFKQTEAQEKFDQLVSDLERKVYSPGKVRLLGEILWLADLSVTYMGSDPIRAWDRVSKLYDELYLPRFEAVSRTDAFFSDFADNELFKEIIRTRNFPEILRQRWNLVYQFFHEGNPSTQLNRTISSARRLYLKVNLDVGMRNCEMLYRMASNHWSEYFIGIGKDQNEVLRAKSTFATLEPQNASSFWGDAMKLIPRIQDRSIDNFFIVLPERNISSNTLSSLKSLLPNLRVKLVNERGAVQILTDMNAESDLFKELASIITSASFQLSHEDNMYFPMDWDDGSLQDVRNLNVLALRSKGSSE
ncbi:MAG TPA: HD domain-containing protein [Nitrososphaeraceae archaeon]|nr:HD domain-containing protein [Nitrososphaeraceae archaeon]